LPTVSIAFWRKPSPVDFNCDVAVCFIFHPCTTSPAIFNPVFKASLSRMKPTHRYDKKAYTIITYTKQEKDIRY
jgi:hypothetical protein